MKPFVNWCVIELKRPCLDEDVAAAPGAAVLIITFVTHPQHGHVILCWLATCGPSEFLLLYSNAIWSVHEHMRKPASILRM